MVKLNYSSDFEIKPIPPYNFHLTVRKPAGWSLFTPLEIYDEETLWTSLYLDRRLIGLKLDSKGTTRNPRIIVRMFLKSKLENGRLDKIEKSLIHCLGADDDLREFYALAQKDSILKYVISDLDGMHSTLMGDNVFPDAVLAILLQMAPLKRSNEMMDCVIRNYGEAAEFDGKVVHAWPIPQRFASLNPSAFAKTCKVGYRAKRIIKLSEKLVKENFPTLQELETLSPQEAKLKLLELPGIGDYSADIINPHGGFPIDAWSVEVFGKLFFGKKPANNRQAIQEVKSEGIRRWGKWSWMAFFYVVQDLEKLSQRLNMTLRLA